MCILRYLNVNSSSGPEVKDSVKDGEVGDSERDAALSGQFMAMKYELAVQLVDLAACAHSGSKQEQSLWRGWRQL